MPEFKDLTGQKFGRLYVTSRAESSVRKNGKPRTRWNCLCDCGNEIVVNADALTRGTQVSCGCYRSEALAKVASSHGNSKSRQYGIWCSMKSRCINKNNKNYPLYGGRGISVCDEWKTDFNNFNDWLIENGYDDTLPRGEQTLDRIDVNGNYCPENCRLATQQEQMNNVRYNHIVEYNGESHTVAEWGRITGIQAEKIENRMVRLGWTAERALTTR